MTTHTMPTWVPREVSLGRPVPKWVWYLQLHEANCYSISSAVSSWNLPSPCSSIGGLASNLVSWGEVRTQRWGLTESLYKIVGPGLPLTLCLCSLTPTGVAVFQNPMVCKIMCGALPHPPRSNGATGQDENSKTVSQTNLFSLLINSLPRVFVIVIEAN